MGKSQPSDSEVNMVGRGLRFPATTEGSQLLSCLLYGTNNKNKANKQNRTVGITGE